MLDRMKAKLQMNSQSFFILQFLQFCNFCRSLTANQQPEIPAQARGYFLRSQRRSLHNDLFPLAGHTGEREIGNRKRFKILKRTQEKKITILLRIRSEYTSPMVQG